MSLMARMAGAEFQLLPLDGPCGPSCPHPASLALPTQLPVRPLEVSEFGISDLIQYALGHGNVMRPRGRVTFPVTHLGRKALESQRGGTISTHSHPPKSL